MLRYVLLHIFYFLLGQIFILGTHAGSDCLKENMRLRIRTKGRLILLYAPSLTSHMLQIYASILGEKYWNGFITYLRFGMSFFCQKTSKYSNGA